MGFMLKHQRLPTHSHQRPQPRPARIISGGRPVPARPPLATSSLQGIDGGGRRGGPSHLALPFSGAFFLPGPRFSSTPFSTLLKRHPIKALSCLPIPLSFLLGFPPPGFPTTWVLCLHPGGGEEDQNLTAWVQSPVLFAGPSGAKPPALGRTLFNLSVPRSSHLRNSNDYCADFKGFLGGASGLISCVLLRPAGAQRDQHSSSSDARAGAPGRLGVARLGGCPIPWSWRSRLLGPGERWGCSPVTCCLSFRD